MKPILKKFMLAGVTIVLALIIFAFEVGIAMTVLAQTTIVQNSAPSDSSLTAQTAPASVNMMDKIHQGMTLLSASGPLKFQEQRSRWGSQLVRKQISLALLDLTTGKVFEKRVWVNQQDVTNYGKTGFLQFTPDLPDEVIDIQPNWWNSFNTDYYVNDPNLVVVANKYLMLSTDIPNPKDRAKTKYTDIVYAPYSDKLATPDVIAAGKAYINSQTDVAFALLAQRRVSSKSVPGQLVTDVVNKDFIKNIIVVEHVDPNAFNNSLDGGLTLTERVLAIIGANQNKAFNYTGSPAGAMGMAQFIKSTYLTTRAAYPAAALISDFTSGMADHKNAIMAMVLFFDSHKKAIQDKVSNKSLLAQFGGVPEEMLAAAYNGDSSRVITSVNRYGVDWASGQLDSSLPKIFRAETLAYISKFISIKSLHIF